eukprot:jgi/Picsp_1/4752/NSC_02120-R1_methyltransferase-like protein 22-like
MEKGDNVTSMRLETDSDGDVTVERSKLKPLSVTVHCSNALRERVHKIENNEKETENSKAYYIHALIESSPVDTCCLEQVGLAVWNGAYLMMEYLMSNETLVKDKHVLELGAGTGLVCLVCHDLGARRVVLTDCCQQVLANSKRNIRHVSDVVDVLKLDWNCELPAIDIIFRADILVATDPIYDNDLTESFMKTCLNLMIQSSSSDVCLYIALEKRMVFTMQQLKAHYPHYEYWRQLFVSTKESNPQESLKPIQVDGYCIAGKQIELESIPCCIPQYQRSPHMEVWKLWLTGSSTL